MKKMTNSERYRAGFDNLHLSEDFRARLSDSLEKEREGIKVNKTGFIGLSRVAAAIAICTVAFGSVCYAGDVGGIRTNLKLWMNGKSENIVIENAGDGVFTWTGENGEEYGFGGYAAVEGEDGVTNIPAEELVSYMNNRGELEFKEDGKVLFHYHNLSEDVTDLIDSDGKLYIHVADPVNPNTYFGFSSIKPDGTFSMDCSDTPEGSAQYHEADVTGLISDEPVEGFDENTAFSYTTTVTE